MPEPAHKVRRRWGVTACALLLVVTTVVLLHPDGGPSETRFPYSGTNYYAPAPPGCPFNSAWTTPCYGAARRDLEEDLRFIDSSIGSGLQRIWVSLDQLFDCFDPQTGFCGYDQAALGNVVDTLHLVARY